MFREISFILEIPDIMSPVPRKNSVLSAQEGGSNVATKEDLEGFVTQVTRPEDFGHFWNGVLAGLGEIDLNPRISPVPMRSTEEVHVSQASDRSLGGLEIATWYCVPTQGDGPFPAIIRFPGYKGEPGL